VLNLKQQLTPQDSAYLRLSYSDNEYGDVNQYYDQGEANLGFRAKEQYEPSLLAGYHHEWSPGSHTLVLAGRLKHFLETDSSFRQTFFVNRGFVGNPGRHAVAL
jgi:hypothetical protein